MATVLKKGDLLGYTTGGRFDFRALQLYSWVGTQCTPPIPVLARFACTRAERQDRRQAVELLRLRQGISRRELVMLQAIAILGGWLLMMGQHDRPESLFYYFRIEDQVPQNHLLRFIDRYVSFDFVRKKLRASYSEKGRCDYGCEGYRPHPRH